MLVARRVVLSLPMLVTVAVLREADASEFENLEYRGGHLYWSQGSAVAAVGRTGVKADKREGDGATPAGTYPLVSVYYRPDKVAEPGSHLPVTPLAPNYGWVDAPADPNYNRLVFLPYPTSAEEMWRPDDLYDALVVIGYNLDPVIPGAGSAIFLHIASRDFAPTAGCIAIEKESLLDLLPLLGPGSKITIKE